MRLIRSERGFTLIELVIVLVILGILGAVAMLGYVDLSAQARDAAIEGTFGSHSSQLAIAIGLCRSLPAQASGTGACNGTTDFAGDFETTVYNAVGVTGSEIARSAYGTPAAGQFNICSGSTGNGRFTTVTYNPAATPQLVRAAIANWAGGLTCATAS
ncbi:MAG: type II secretion system protein [Nitrospirota bacterium]